MQLGAMQAFTFVSDTIIAVWASPTFCTISALALHHGKASTMPTLDWFTFTKDTIRQAFVAAHATPWHRAPHLTFTSWALEFVLTLAQSGV
jgi:hypothetical protein